MKMKKMMRKLFVLLMIMGLAAGLALSASAAETEKETAETGALSVNGTLLTQEEEDSADALSGKAAGAALCVGLAAAAGALGMGMAISKAVEGIARQPEAEGKIRTSLMLGLVFIETAIIYALIIAILIIFVL